CSTSRANPKSTAVKPSMMSPEEVLELDLDARVVQRLPRRVPAGEPVHAGPRGCRGGRQVDAGQGGAPRRARDDRTAQRLTEREGPAEDVAADLCRIALRAVGRWGRVHGDDAI